MTFHRNPIYNTGKEFFENLKFLLSIVYFQRFDYLGKLREKKVEDYILYLTEFMLPSVYLLNKNNNYLKLGIINNLNIINKIHINLNNI